MRCLTRQRSSALLPENWSQPNRRPGPVAAGSGSPSLIGVRRHWPRAERGGYFDFCRRLAPVLDGRGEVTVRPEEVIEPVRIMGALHAGHHQWDRYGGYASGLGADHWGGT